MTTNRFFDGLLLKVESYKGGRLNDVSNSRERISCKDVSYSIGSKDCHVPNM